MIQHNNGSPLSEQEKHLSTFIMDFLIQRFQCWMTTQLLCSTKKLCAVTIESEITLSVKKTCHVFDLRLNIWSAWKVEHVDILVAFCSNIFISPPTHTCARTDIPPLPIPSPSSVFCTFMSFIQFLPLLGLGRKFLPQKH